MELRYQMTDILPLLPIPQPPHGRSAYNIPCPLCDRPGTREKHLNINLKRNVYRCPKVRDNSRAASSTSMPTIWASRGIRCWRI